MKYNILLSIIIPIYGIREDMLRQCLNSLTQNKRHDQCQVILVDDGSPDNCGHICDEYAKINAWFTVIHQKNAGVSVARNTGINASYAPYVTFIDPDDWVDASYISTIISTLMSNKNADIMIFDYFDEFQNTSIGSYLGIESGKIREDDLLQLRKALFGLSRLKKLSSSFEIKPVWNKIYKLDFLKINDLLFVDSAVKGQDALLNAEAFQKTNRVYYIQKKLYHYRHRKSSITGKFNPGIVRINLIAYARYRYIINSIGLDEEYSFLLNDYILKSFYSILRLYYFHSDNRMMWSSVKRQIVSLLNEEPFNQAFHNHEIGHLRSEEKLFVYLINAHAFYALRLVMRFRVRLQSRNLFC